MAFEIAAVNKLGKHELLKGGNRAGIEAELFLKFADEALRQNHISYTQSRRNGF